MAAGRRPKQADSALVYSQLTRLPLDPRAGDLQRTREAALKKARFLRDIGGVDLWWKAFGVPAPRYKNVNVLHVCYFLP